MICSHIQIDESIEMIAFKYYKRQRFSLHTRITTTYRTWTKTTLPTKQ